MHRMVERCLEEHGVVCEHEVRLGCRCRIDLMVGDVGIEMKRGKPQRQKVLEQLMRYAACERVSALILVAERSVDLPHALCGKPLYTICLNRLWGIAI